MKNLLRLLSFVAIVVACVIDCRAFDELSLDEHKFFGQIKSSIENRDVAWLSAHTVFPFYVLVKNKFLLLKSKEEFEAHFDEIINEYVVKQVRCSTVESLSKNYRGVWINDGVIWFASIIECNSKSSATTATHLSIIKINNWEVLPPGVTVPVLDKSSPE